jgi:imidazolonepropionase-like amidohydrolase
MKHSPQTGRGLTALCLGLALAVVAAGGHELRAAEKLLVRAQTLHTVDGPPLSPGAVLIENGKITAVGASLEADAETRVVQVPTLIPGLVDAWSREGLPGGTTEITEEVVPLFETEHSLHPRHRAFAEALSDGVTTLHVVPGPDSVVSGLSCIVKPIPAGAQVISSRAALCINVCSDPAGQNRSRARPDSIYVRQPTNRMGVVWILRRYFQLALGESGESTAELAAVRESLAGARPVMALCRLDHDIRTLITLATDHQFSPVVVGGDEAHKVLDALVANKLPVVYLALNTGALEGAERSELAPDAAGRLHAEGVPVAISGGDLLDRARFAARYGMDRQAALAAVTSEPARLLRIETRVGRIAVGLDADLVALDGDPLEFTTAVQWVMVNGDITNDAQVQP